MKDRHIAQMIHRQIESGGARAAVHFKKDGIWQALSWREYGQAVSDLSRALIHAGIGSSVTVAIWAENSPEWSIADYAVMSVRGVTVPIYATSSTDQVLYILKDAEAAICFVSNSSKAERLLQSSTLPSTLQKIVCFDKVPAHINDTRLVSWNDFLREARDRVSHESLLERLDQVNHEDLCTIIYTSGTTGEPKGVTLNHDNLMSQLTALDARFEFSEQDRELAFLPLSHAYGRVSGYWVQSHGAEVYYCDDPKKVVSYLQEVRPTFMVGVPRLYEKIYAAAQHRLQSASPLKKKLFAWALAVGMKQHLARLHGSETGAWQSLSFALADKLVLRKIRQLLGGSIRFLSAGGAPLAKEIEEFFFSCGIFIAQGYGLTETSPTISCNSPASFRFGSTGKPIPGCEVKIAEDGEILVKGINVTRGYFHKPLANQEAFDLDGWFHTGDIGRLDSDGFLFITDRKKELIVTAGGKKVAPQLIEKYLGGDFYIDQVACFGDRRSYISALLVPNFEALEAYFKEQGILFAGPEAMVADPRVVAFIQTRIDEYADRFADFEKVKSFRLLPKPLSIEQGEITPTFKIRRKVVEAHYASVIESMYGAQAALGSEPHPKTQETLHRASIVP